MPGCRIRGRRRTVLHGVGGPQQISNGTQNGFAALLSADGRFEVYRYDRPANTVACITNLAGGPAAGATKRCASAAKAAASWSAPTTPACASSTPAPRCVARLQSARGQNHAEQEVVVDQQQFQLHGPGRHAPRPLALSTHAHRLQRRAWDVAPCPLVRCRAVRPAATIAGCNTGDKTGCKTGSGLAPREAHPNPKLNMSRSPGHRARRQSQRPASPHHRMAMPVAA